MTNIEKIRQEIERRREANKRQYLSSSGDMSWQRMCGEEDCLVELLAFIDSLPEEKPSEDLEKTASRLGFDYVDNIIQESPGHRWNDHDVDFGYRDGFIAGAKWMRKKDVEDMYMSDNRHFLKCYEQGKVDMKVQMMKDAVDYKIVNNLAAYPVIYYEVDHLGLKYGDKVKMIILKDGE